MQRASGGDLRGGQGVKAALAWLRDKLDAMRRRSETVNALVVLGTGQTWAQLAQIAFIPVLTRLYGPAQYGEFALFSLVSTTGTVFCTWRYELAIVLADDDAKAYNLLALTVVLAIICSAGIWAGLHAADGWIRASSGAVFFPSAPGWLCAAMLLQSLYLAMGYWLLRLKAFNYEARGRIALAVGVGGAQVVAFSGWMGNGLIAGYVVGYGVAVAVLGCAIVFHCPTTLGRAGVVGMLVQARRFRRFPLISTWEVFAARAVLLLPLALLTAFFGATVTGLFSLARNIYNIPLSLVSEPASRIFLIKAREFAAAADADADGLRGLVASWMWKLAVAGIVVLGGGCFVVSGGFGLLFGSRWAEAGIFMFALLPISLARFVVVPVMPVLIVFERQVLQLLWQSGLALLTFVGYSVLGFITGPVMVVACVGVLCASWYAVLALGILRHGGRGKMLFDQGTDETRWSRE